MNPASDLHECGVGHHHLHACTLHQWSGPWLAGLAEVGRGWPKMAAAAAARANVELSLTLRAKRDVLGPSLGFIDRIGSGIANYIEVN